MALEERGLHEALSDGGSAGKEARANVMLVCYLKYMNITYSCRQKKITYVCVDFFTRRKLELHAQTLGTKTPALDSAVLLIGE
jgi:hypothetical protein